MTLICITSKEETMPMSDSNALASKPFVSARLSLPTRMRVSGVLTGLAIAAASAFLSPCLQAQEYPNKPLRFVVASQAGGVVDIRARKIGQRMTEYLKQAIVVDNKPGASTTIGAEFVAKSAPDGYTALFGGNNEVVIVPALGMPIRYDPVKDLIPVAQFSLGYPVMVVHAGMGVKSLAELVDWARANPGKLTCGTAGHGSGQHFICELLARSAKIQLRSVPYKGTGPMLVDVAGGQIHVAIGFLAEVDKQYIVPGKVIPIATLAPKRLSRFAQLPTMLELGHEGFETVSWTGLFVPAGTPKEAITRLNAAVVNVIKEPEIMSWLTETGSEVVTPTPEEFALFTRAQLEKWRKLSNDFNIKWEQ
jgi:tripartite-type tricarboxylate transporter receptor subunit TctC